MPLISMVGCNAIGKTTASRRWAARYPALVVVNADIQLETAGGVGRRLKATKGTTEEKAALVGGYAAGRPVVLWESVRTTHLVDAPADAPVLIVTCEWRLYEKHMRARCAAKGKRYRDDYWTEWKLGYECHRRYVNYAEKSLAGRPVHHFVIADQAADWPAVDECFYALYRKAHNAANRRVIA